MRKALSEWFERVSSTPVGWLLAFLLLTMLAEAADLIGFAGDGVAFLLRPEVRPFISPVCLVVVIAVIGLSVKQVNGKLAEEAAQLERTAVRIDGVVAELGRLIALYKVLERFEQLHSWIVEVADTAATDLEHLRTMDADDRLRVIQSYAVCRRFMDAEFRMKEVDTLTASVIPGSNSFPPPPTLEFVQSIEVPGDEAFPQAAKAQRDGYRSFYLHFSGYKVAAEARRVELEKLILQASQAIHRRAMPLT